MQIDLRECETLVINLARDELRRARMAELCATLNLSHRFVDAIEAKPGFIGCGLSHIHAFRASQVGRPLLLLEDDLGVTEDYQPVVVVPDNADALYLGTSNFGGLEPLDYVGHEWGVAADAVSDTLYRTYNMLGTHAILYLTDRYKRAAENAMLTALVDRKWDPDRGLASIQSQYMVYAVRRPAFYQAAAVQTYSGGHGEHLERFTKTPLQCQPEGTRTYTANAQGQSWFITLARKSDGTLSWALD